MLDTGQFSHWCSLVYQLIWQGLSSLLLTVLSLHDSSREHHTLGLPPVSEWHLCSTVSAAPHSMSPDVGGARAQHVDPSSSLAYLISFTDLTQFHYSVYPYRQDPTLYPKSGPIPKMLSCASSYLFSTCMWVSIRYLTFNISKVNCSCFSLVLISFSVVLINGDSIFRVAQAKKSRHHHWLLPFSHTLIQTVSKFYCHCLRNAWRIWPLLTRLVVAIHNLLESCDRVHVEAPSFTLGTYTLFLMQQLKWSNPSMILISE